MDEHFWDEESMRKWEQKRGRRRRVGKEGKGRGEFGESNMFDGRECINDNA